jgi:hypothetical protein
VKATVSSSTTRAEVSVSSLAPDIPGTVAIRIGPTVITLELRDALELYEALLEWCVDEVAANAWPQP